MSTQNICFYGEILIWSYANIYNFATMRNWRDLWMHKVGSIKQKKCLRTCEKPAYSNHPAFAQSIIQVFALHLYILYYPMIQLSDSEGQIRLHIFVRICQKTSSDLHCLPFCFCIST